MSQKTKILYLHTGAELYGADQILLSIVCNLDKKQYEPIVVLPNDGPLVDELRKNDIKVKIIPYPIIRRKYFTPIGVLCYVIKYKRACKKLEELVLKEKIEIIHNNTIAVLEGITIKRKCNVTLITHVHEMIEKPKVVANFLYKKHLKYADKILCVSKAVKRHIESFQVKDTYDKVSVINNGIKTIAIDKSGLREEFGIPSQAKLFTIVGRINAIKGQKDFVEAIKAAREKDPNVYGLIVGDAYPGQEWRVDELKALIKSENLNNYVKYIGFVKEIHKVYSITDILVLSSIENDSFPTVVLEAMSCGIPTIAYRCGGVEEMIVDGYNGFLVDQGNISALSQKMLISIGDDYRRSCEEYFEDNFSLDKFIEKIELLYRGASANRRIIIIGQLEQGKLSGPGVIIDNIIRELKIQGIHYNFINTYKKNKVVLFCSILKILFQKNKIVNVHTFGYGVSNLVFIISRFNKRNNYYLTLHGISSYEYSINNRGKKYGARNRKIESKLIKEFPNIICVSKFEKRYIAKQYNRKRNVFVVNNGVRYDKVIRNNQNKEELYLYTGGFSNRKNPLMAIKIFEEILRARPDAKMIICGPIIDDILYSNCIKYIKLKKIQGSIDIMGYLEKSKLYEYYSRAKYIIAPSVFDTYNVSILEAMSCGDIPIVSEQCGISDLLDKNNSIIIGKDDILEKIKIIDENKAKQKNEKIAHSMDSSNMVNNLLEVLKQ